MSHDANTFGARDFEIHRLRTTGLNKQVIIPFATDMFWYMNIIHEIKWFNLQKIHKTHPTPNNEVFIGLKCYQ